MKIFVLIVFALFITNCAKDANFSKLTSDDLDVSSNPTGPIFGPVGPTVGPIVRITKAPADKMINEANEVTFEVIENTHPIKDVTCFINQIELPCDWVKGVLKILPLPLGSHGFEVIAEDIEGLKSSARAQWKVHNRFRLFNDAYQIKADGNAVDILFVIDNSSSMRDEQTKISQRFDRFVEQLQNSDWQIALTTTDVYQTSELWADGKLAPFSSNHLFLKSSMDLSLSQKLFQKHVQRKESGWDTENGINAVYRSLERSMNPKNSGDIELAKFYRKDSALAVVVVSDEDETGNTSKNDGDNLVELVRTKWGFDKKFQFNSIIVHTRQCLQNGGRTMGIKYEKLSQKTKGVVGDICADNYSKILKDIGNNVSNLQKTYTLKCTPQDIDQDGKADVLITGKGSQFVPGFTLTNNILQLDQALSPGDYNFEYYCLETQ